MDHKGTVKQYIQLILMLLAGWKLIVFFSKWVYMNFFPFTYLSEL